ncbi:hypothetical protein D9758_006971 [Tetrapyrgos nigripes]|uniref:Uncharacterized protein n=1 Tax=Tetrapyrgos nigripes TaxID=182062 RepID=A0A8H5GSA8_9AGAR|nr:hypothetical protein D9758_006971 [Tetrapyrgos nigripes]
MTPVFLLPLGLRITLQSFERFVNLQEIDNPKLVLIIGCVGLRLNATSQLMPIPATVTLTGTTTTTTTTTIKSQTCTLIMTMVPIYIPYASANAAVHPDHYHRLEPPAIHPPVGANLGLVGVLIHLLGDAVNNRSTCLVGNEFDHFCECYSIDQKMRAHSPRSCPRASRPRGYGMTFFYSRMWMLYPSTSDTSPDPTSWLPSTSASQPAKTSMCEWSPIENLIQQCYEAYGVNLKHVTISPELRQLPSRTGSQR